jgi:Fur family ferric uptake transcriptional regulator
MARNKVSLPRPGALAARRSDPDAHLRQLLSLSDLPPTEARLLVLRVLDGTAERHLSAERMCAALVRRDAGAAISTFKTAIYELNHAGVLSRVLVPLNSNRQQTLYEIADKPRHRHLYCTGCRKVIEIRDEAMEGRIAHQLARAGLAQAGFDLARTGTCLACTEAIPAQGIAP